MSTPGRAAPPAYLPAERNVFVGRRRELAEVRRLVALSRLVTLTGPGGVGKTRLATRAATDLQRSFPGGTAFVDLATLRDPALVAAHVAAALDVPDVTGRWLVGGLAQVVGDRHLLLVLDNCEHLADACAVLVDGLLSACPRVRVLATSRHPLAVEGESLLPVPPLAVPDPASGKDPLSYAALELLVTRARAVVPGLELGSDDMERLGELCRKLDGIALAIEMAAVRLRTLSPEEILARLDDRFELLRRAGAATPERHRTLRATMEWSYDLLQERERTLWRRASVFAGAFPLSAAQAVCADPDLPADAVLDGVTRLVEASVLEVDRRGSTPWFRMLDTVRSFGRGLLEESEEVGEVRGRHLTWCSELVAAESRKFLGPEQVAAFDRLDAQHPELSAAGRYCLTRPDRHEVGLRLAADLWLYWEARGHVGEGRRLLGALLESGTPPPGPRARGLAVAGFLALGATEPETAVPLLEEARALGEAADDPLATAVATQYLGQAAMFLGEPQRADRLLREAAALYRTVDARYAAFCTADVGVAALLSGALQKAEDALRDSLDLNQGGDPWTRSHALWGLGLVRLSTGRPDAAAELEQQALRLMRRVDDRSGVARCVEALSWVAASQGDWERAALLCGAADGVWGSIPAEPPAPLKRWRLCFISQGPRRLGEKRWATHHERGSALDRRAAAAVALGEPLGEPANRSMSPADMLTKRQNQVAALVARGLTDREIAEQLVISPRTAESHVEQILARLGFRSRSEIAAWTAARGDVDRPTQSPGVR